MLSNIYIATIKKKVISIRSKISGYHVAPQYEL